MKHISERAIVFLVGAVQFVNILDFMIVMPLGPDFARGLGIPEAHLGYIGGAYTLSAGIAGFAGAFFLDRFDRRKALAVCLAGLVLGTAAAGFATGMGSLMAARFLAGVFGGPATSLALSIIADVIPPERRGKAMGAVMGAFSAASVLGVPAALELARLGNWRLPFFGVAVLGAVVTALAIFLLPPLTIHLEQRGDTRPPPFMTLFTRRIVLLSYAMTAVTMAAGFILIPHISTYLQHNLGYPRQGLSMLYLVGGLVTFGTMRAVGWLVDKHGSFRVGTVFSVVLLAILYVGFIDKPGWLPVVAIFVGFMIAMSSRNVSYNTLTTKVPRPAERARFMSIQSMVQHLASAAGAFASGQILTVRADHSLAGIVTLTAVSMFLTALLPAFLWAVEKRVRGQGSGPVAIASRPPAPEAE